MIETFLNLSNAAEDIGRDKHNIQSHAQKKSKSNSTKAIQKL